MSRKRPAFLDDEKTRATLGKGKTYKLVRLFQSGERRTMKSGLSLDEAERAIANPESDSETATSSTAKRRTEKSGPWYDAYGVE